MTTMRRTKAANILLREQRIEMVLCENERQSIYASRMFGLIGRIAVSIAIVEPQ